MERVQSYVNTLMQSHRFGGRSVVRDEKTLILYDTPSWSERESRAVRAKFPECEVAVQSFDGSLSGFVVIISRHTEPYGRLSEVFYVLFVFAMGWTCWCAHGYLQKSFAELGAI
jgi:hypothetical protein